MQIILLKKIKSSIVKFGFKKENSNKINLIIYFKKKKKIFVKP